MSKLLSSLKLSVKPEKTSDNPELKRREKMISRLDQQLAMADALINDEQCNIYKEKWQVNPESQLRELIRIPKNVAKWFYKRNGQYYFEIRYSQKPLELSKNNHAILVGDKENLTSVISTVISAVVAGELDKILTDSASKHALSKK